MILPFKIERDLIIRCYRAEEQEKLNPHNKSTQIFTAAAFGSQISHLSTLVYSTNSEDKAFQTSLSLIGSQSNYTRGLLSSAAQAAAARVKVEINSHSVCH